MKAKPTTPQTQANKLRLHGLDVIDGQQGKTTFRKLVQIRPGRAPAMSVKPIRRNLRQ